VQGYARVLPETEATVEGRGLDEETPAGAASAQRVETRLGDELHLEGVGRPQSLDDEVLGLLSVG